MVYNLCALCRVVWSYMKSTPRTIGFLQAAGLALYVSFFAFSVQFIDQWAKAHGAENAGPTVGITLVLLAFIISASICSSLMFAYPISLFFSHKKTEAIKTLAWSLGWLVIFFGAFLLALAGSIW